MIRRPESRWTVPPATDEAQTQLQVQGLVGALGLPAPLCKLLVARGFADPERAKRFLRPQLEHLHAPRLMRSMDVAVDRLARAITGGELVMVHGDYDVDGMCSTTLMTRADRKSTRLNSSHG